MRENTALLYARWVAHAILAILDIALLLPIGVVMLFAVIIGRGQKQTQALDSILAEIKELPYLTKEEKE